MTTIAAPPPVAPPPQLTPGGRTAFRLVLIAVASLLVVGTVASLGVAAWGVSTVRVVTDHQTLPATMRALTVDAGSIPAVIRITADRDTTEPQVRMRLVNAFQGDEPQLTVSDSGDEAAIRIAGEASPVQWGRAGEITVSLPPTLARRLSVSTLQQAGPLLADADVDELVARTTHGPVLLRGAARRIEIHTVNGDVESRDPIAVTEEFSASTSDGDIAVDFRNSAPRTVDAISRNGSIVIGLPERGPYLVRAQAGESTRVRVPETTNPDIAVGEVTARADDGDVVIDRLGGLGRG